MKTIVLALLLSSIFLAPTIQVGPTVYDGRVYNHTIAIDNPYYQVINDLQMVLEVSDYYDYHAIQPDFGCDYLRGALTCAALHSQPIKRGALVTIQTTAPTAPTIVWVERNFDSLSLPRLVVIKPTAQHALFVPLIGK